MKSSWRWIQYKKQQLRFDIASCLSRWKISRLNPDTINFLPKRVSATSMLLSSCISGNICLLRSSLVNLFIFYFSYVRWCYLLPCKRGQTYVIGGYIDLRVLLVLSKTFISDFVVCTFRCTFHCIHGFFCYEDVPALFGMIFLRKVIKKQTLKKRSWSNLLSCVTKEDRGAMLNSPWFFPRSFNWAKIIRFGSLIELDFTLAGIFFRLYMCRKNAC